MNYEEALILLGVSEVTEIAVEKRLEEILLEQKNYFFKTTLNPKVIASRLRKLKSFLDAENTLYELNNRVKTIPEPVKSEFKSKHEIIDFYRNYEQQLSKAKLGLMNADSLITLSNYLAELQLVEEERMISVSGINLEVDDTFIDVKISDFVNSGVIIKKLEALDTHKISDELLAVEELAKDIVRCRKYTKFVTN